MTYERKLILDKVNALINKKKEELLNLLPIIHEISDGIIIRFFTEWDNCDDNNNIKYKRIVNENNLEEKIIFFYLPKGAYFELKRRDYINSLTCLNGKLEISYDNNVHILNENTKISLDSNMFEGKALENTYVLTTNKI